MATKPLSDQLREAVRKCGKTRYRISQETGIPQATLSRFVNGLAGLGMANVDILGECLGLRLVLPKPKAGVKRPKRRQVQRCKRPFAFTL